MPFSPPLRLNAVLYCTAKKVRGQRPPSKISRLSDHYSKEAEWKPGKRFENIDRAALETRVKSLGIE